MTIIWHRFFHSLSIALYRVIFHFFAAKLKDMYVEQPEKVIPYLPRFVEVMAEGNDPMMILIIQMFTEVAKTAPTVSYVALASSCQLSVSVYCNKWFVLCASER